jgi:hypothetical protein
MDWKVVFCNRVGYIWEKYPNDREVYRSSKLSTEGNLNVPNYIKTAFFGDDWLCNLEFVKSITTANIILEFHMSGIHTYFFGNYRLLMCTILWSI